MGMDELIPPHVLDTISTFGEMLRYLRRRAGLSQTDLSIAVGYSDAQISRLEKNRRLPDIANITARFVPALRLQREPAVCERLLQLAAAARRRKADAEATIAGSDLRRSIAVLPFWNLSADPDNDYLCDGLADELISALTKIRHLFVVARSSAFAFKRMDLDAREVGRRLNVDTILEGTVKKAGDRLRVSVRLINAANGFQLWSERFDRRMTDLFELQDDVTLAIISQLKVEVLETEKLALLNRQQGSLQAYNLYLKGRYYWAQRPQGIAKAIEYFERSIDEDPRSALARAGLADCYVTLGSWENGTLPPVVAMAKAKSAATKALELDGRLAEAHATLAYRTTHYDWDWDTAELQYRRAIELNPNYAVSYHWYSHYLTAMGRTEESLVASKRCLELDPLDLVINIHMAWHHHFARQFDEAVDQCWKTTDLHPNSFWSPYFFALAYQQQGRIADAAAEFHKAIEMSGNVTFTSAGLGHLHGVAGDRAEARRIFEDLQERAQRTYVPAYDLALVCVGLGWTDQAFEWLDRAHEERSGWLTYLKVEPRLDSLRNDARFGEMLQRCRLL
jgi:TolB-like protein/Tfp pilus assembly protein PilF/DNA-binding XRE family transcriptional regulator